MDKLSINIYSVMYNNVFYSSTIRTFCINPCPCPGSGDIFASYPKQAYRQVNAGLLPSGLDLANIITARQISPLLICADWEKNRFVLDAAEFPHEF